MKTSISILTCFITLLIYQQAFCQVPQGFKYQAVCRDNAGDLIQNQSVNLRLSVHDLNPAGNIVYQETFTVVTNQFGLITLDVGKGNVQSGTLISIPWEAGDKFLEIELDPGSGYSSMGTTQLLSVPYALHAETAESITGAITETDPEVGSNTMHYLSKWDGTSLVSSSIFDSGNIGIGTSNAVKKLTVGGNAQIQSDGDWFPGATARLYLGPDDNMWIEHIHSGGLNLEVCSGWPLFIRNGGNVTMSIDGSGHVGIGTEYPSSLLDVNGAINAWGGNSDNWNTAYSWGNHATAGYLTSEGDGVIGNEVVNTTNSTLNRNGSGTAANPFTLSLNLSNTNTWSGAQTFSANSYFPGTSVWTSTGKVGIGTTEPASILHLIGDTPKFKIQTQTNLTDPSVEFIKYGVRTMEIKLTDGGGGTGLQFIDQNSEQVRMFIKASTGNVGIGTTSPGATLEVNGQVKITGGAPGAGKILTSDGTGLASWVAPASSGSHYIGETYGGGIVFYVYDNGQHGLIAATSDQNAGIQWSNGVYRYTGTTGNGLGAGAMNTALIVSTQMGDNETGNFAAKVCIDYSVTANGIVYGDWYLPSKYESDLLYLQKDIVGGFSDADYWTSTEESFASSFAIHKYFGPGAQTFPSDVKYHAFKVRAVRAF